MAILEIRGGPRRSEPRILGVAMRGRKSALTIVLTPSDRAEIQRWQRATTGPVGLARRGRVLLLLEQGMTLKDAAERSGLSVRHTRKWAERFRRHGLVGLRDKPRPGRTPVVSPRGRAAPGQDGLRAAR
jgi:CRP-like cAMP-binding protein